MKLDPGGVGGGVRGAYDQSKLYAYIKLSEN